MGNKGIIDSGGLAPCLSSAVGRLIERYNEVSPEIEHCIHRWV